MAAPTHILSLEQMLQQSEGKRGPLIAAAGCFDAFSARLAQQAGYEALMVGGAAMALSRFGRPAPQLLSPEAITETLYIVRDAGDAPLVADVADGFGNALHVGATVRSFEFAGASVVQISDRPLRRRDRAEGPRFAVAEMIGKLKSALDERRHCLVAAVVETDQHDSANAISDRAAAYVETGADLLVLRSEGVPQPLSKYQSCTDLVAPVAFEWGQSRDPAMEGGLSRKGYRLTFHPYVFTQLMHAAGTELAHSRSRLQ